MSVCEVPRIQRYIESPSPYKKSFIFDAFDNPSYDDEAKKKIEASINQLPPSEREQWYNVIRHGAWMESELSVYAYDSEMHAATLPDHDHPRVWRHYETVDPAASGRCGFLLCAEDPKTGLWYVVKAKYLEGQAPSDLLDALHTETAGFHVTHRTSDPNASWFVKEAAKRGKFYGSLVKDNRKDELVQGPKKALSEGWLKVVEEGCELLIEEFGTARWSDRKEGHIANSTKYHILDCLQYFCDCRPKFSPSNANPDPLILLDLANQKRKKSEAARAKKKSLKLRPAFRLRR